MRSEPGCAFSICMIRKARPKKRLFTSKANTRPGARIVRKPSYFLGFGKKPRKVETILAAIVAHPYAYSPPGPAEAMAAQPDPSPH
jgi:hypothetical protein